MLLEKWSFVARIKRRGMSLPLAQKKEGGKEGEEEGERERGSREK